MQKWLYEVSFQTERALLHSGKLTLLVFGPRKRNLTPFTVERISYRPCSTVNTIDHEGIWYKVTYIHTYLRREREKKENVQWTTRRIIHLPAAQKSIPTLPFYLYSYPSGVVQSAKKDCNKKKNKKINPYDLYLTGTNFCTKSLFSSFFQFPIIQKPS